MMPKTSHLNIFIMHLILKEGMSGADIRSRLSLVESRARTTGAFYQLMGRMEEQYFVMSSYRRRQVGSYVCRETYYFLTKEGRKVLDDAFSFYADMEKERKMVQLCPR